MIRQTLAWIQGIDMEAEPADFERPPYPLFFPSDCACLWDLGYLLAEALTNSMGWTPSD